MKRIVAVDSGKFATKAVGKDNKGKIIQKSFRTKMDKTNEKKADGDDSFVVEFQNHHVIIGQQAEALDYDKDKAKIIHKISIFTAISQLVDEGDVVRAGIGFPVESFLNVEERLAFKKYLEEDKEVRLTVNGNPFSFTFEEAVPFPEGSGIILKNMDKYQDRLVGIIDIGGLNMNGCVYENGNPKPSTSITINKGANILRNELRLKLNKEFKCNIQEYQMEQIIKDGYIRKNPEESKAFISAFRQEYVDQIVKEATMKNWDIENMDIIFVGGGSLLLEEEIKKAIPHSEISKNAIWDNVEGFGFVMGM